VSIGVYIGRFQPFHNGHAAVLRRALGKFDRVVVLLGSSQEKETLRNPFSWGERADMIGNTFPDEWSFTRSGPGRLFIAPVEDCPDDNGIWVHRVTSFIGAHRALTGDDDVKLVGYDKDASSFYLKLLPWPLHIDAEPTRTEDGNVLGSTQIRKLWLDGDLSFEKYVPFYVAFRLKVHMNHDIYATLIGKRVISERNKK